MSPNAIDVTPNRIDAFLESCVCDKLAYEDDPHPRRLPDIGPDESWDAYRARTKAEFDAIVADLFADFDADDIALMYAGNEVYVADPLAAPCTRYEDDPTAAEPDAAEPDPFEAAVSNRLEWIRANAEAKRRFDAEQSGDAELPPVRNLTELLETRYEDPDYLVAELAPTGGKVMVAAQGKAGKTQTMLNLVRSLADGGPFLGRFAIRPGAHRIVVIDDELSDRQIQKWFAGLDIQNTAAVADVVGLRGQAGLFNILDEQTRARWAARLRQLDCTVLIFDCLRPVFDALGLDENRDAGRFLVAFDALVREAGIGESFVVHHMGHSGERTRGDSRLVDWPDATWKLVREDAENADSARYFSAYGRDVSVPEGRLTFDPATRRLTYSDGSRSDAKAEAALIDVLAALNDDAGQGGSGLSGRNIEAATADAGHGRSAVRRAIRLGILRGLVEQFDGQRRAKLHRLAVPVAAVEASADAVSLRAWDASAGQWKGIAGTADSAKCASAPQCAASAPAHS